MISEILALRSSFPSAFSSLGVGSIALVGQVPFASILRQKFPSGFDELVLSQTLKSAMPFIIGLSFFFVVYCTGFVLIAMAGRFRGQHVSSDARRLVKVLSAKHDLLSKFYFEQRAIIEVRLIPLMPGLLHLVGRCLWGGRRSFVAGTCE